MPVRAESPNDNKDMILGELRGQVRELVHSVNNLNSKFDGLTREVIALGPIAADIGDIKNRLVKLEGSENRQDGAVGILKIILTSPVVLALLITAATVWLVLTGKVHVS